MRNKVLLQRVRATTALPERPDGGRDLIDEAQHAARLLGAKYQLALADSGERAAPPGNGLVDLPVKGDAGPAQRHVEPVAAAVCQLVQGVLAAEPRELQDMGVVGMLGNLLCRYTTRHK